MSSSHRVQRERNGTQFYFLLQVYLNPQNFVSNFKICKIYTLRFYLKETEICHAIFVNTYMLVLASATNEQLYIVSKNSCLRSTGSTCD